MRHLTRDVTGVTEGLAWGRRGGLVSITYNEQNLGGLCVTRSGESSKRPATGRRSICSRLAQFALLLHESLVAVVLDVFCVYWSIAVAGNED